MSIDRLTRPIVGIKNRSAQEVFDIMVDRIRSALLPSSTPAEAGQEQSRVEALQGLLFLADQALMELHGCFPLDRVTEDQRRLNDAAKAIRAVTGNDYLIRTARAEEVRAALENRPGSKTEAGA